MRVQGLSVQLAEAERAHEAVLQRRENEHKEGA